VISRKHPENYVTNTFLLVNSSVRSKQLLRFVHGQGQKANTNIQHFQRTLSGVITIPLALLTIFTYVIRTQLFRGFITTKLYMYMYGCSVISTASARVNKRASSMIVLLSSFSCDKFPVLFAAFPAVYCSRQ